MTKAKGACGGREDPSKLRANWREASIEEIKSLVRVADMIHPDLPESDEVFTERIKLFPEGCLVLMEEEKEDLWGYVISHPIRRGRPPTLNSLLGEIASDADQYYIHDLAILPRAQGCGFARECIDMLFAIARRYTTTSLVSVYGTVAFWAHFGFVSMDLDGALEKKLLGYGHGSIYLERKNEEYPPQTTDT